MSLNEEIEALLTRLLDDAPDETAAQELDALLEAHPECIDRAREHLKISEMLRQQGEEANHNSFAENCCAHIESLGNESPEDFPLTLVDRIWHRRRMATFGMMAAAFAIFLGIAAFFTSRPSPNASAVGSITYLDVNGETSSKGILNEGEIIDLQKGFAQLRFASGAIIAVESPANLSIKDAMNLSVHNGRITGWCPPQAHGFRVDTEDGSLVDLGTSFGVVKHLHGASDFLVFNGEVEVSKNDQSIVLTEAQSLTASASLNKRSFEPVPYSQSWRICHGILNTIGSITACEADIPAKIINQRDDENLIIYPELRNQRITQTLNAEVTEPGSFEIVRGERRLPPNKFTPPSETNLNSYLVRAAPYKSMRYHYDHIRYIGSVTFDAPILAVITRTETLTESDELFVHKEWPIENWPELRGLEINSPEAPGNDKIELSEDRRTLYFDFSTGVGTDVVRVLTQAQ